MSEGYRTIAIVGADHEESLRTLREFPADGDVRFMLFGDRSLAEERARHLGIDIGEVPFVACSDESHACRLAVKAAKEGLVQVLMKGNVHTAEFLRALLDKDSGLMEEESLLSHVARLRLPWYHKALLLTDAAVSIFPDLDKKVKIISNALHVATRCGVGHPKVALVCPVETVNPKMVSTTDASQIVFLQKNTAIFGDAVVEGPFGLDVALSGEAARIKGVGGEAPGDADILLLANLDAANATYKAFLSAPGVSSAGILVGAKIPVVLTSRSESMQTRMDSISLALTVCS